MTQVRVLSVIHHFRPDYSGEGEWWLRMLPLLKVRGIEVEILTGASQAGTPSDTDLVDNTRVHRVSIANGKHTYARHIWGLLIALRALVQLRRRFDLMLFHSPNYDTVYASCVAGRVFGWKTVYKTTLRGSDDLDTIARSTMLGRVRIAALTLADGFVAMSRVLLHPYQDEPWIRSKLLVVPQGVDLERFHPVDPMQKRFLRRQFAIPDDARVALFCGAIIHRKGVDILIEAWRDVIRSVPSAILLLVGPNHEHGLDQPELRAFSESIVQRLHDLALVHTVRLLGYQQHVDQFYAVADVFVFPSRAEGWPSAIAEAMASGLPSVVSSLYGVSEEQVNHGVDAFVVSSQDPQHYAERLVTLLTDPDTAGRMGENARKHAQKYFGAELIADQYATFFRRIAANRSRVD